RDTPAVAVAKTPHHGGDCPPGDLERFAASQQRAQDIDQNNLSRVMPEMIFVKPAHHLAFIDLEALGHESAEAVQDEGLRTPRGIFLSNLERRKPKIGLIR